MPLIAVLKEPNLVVRVETAGALGQLKDARAQGPLLAMLRDPDARLREAAARALGALGRPEAIPHLLASLADRVPLVVEAAAMGLSLLELAPRDRTADRPAREGERGGPAAGGRARERAGAHLGQGVRLRRGAVARVVGRGEGPAVAAHRDAARRRHGGRRALLRVPGPLEQGHLRARRQPEHGVEQTASRRRGTSCCRCWSTCPGRRASTWSRSATRPSCGRRTSSLRRLSNVQRALGYVRRQEPQNGTAAYEALQAAFARPRRRHDLLPLRRPSRARAS